MGGKVPGPHTQEHQGTELAPECCQSETERNVRLPLINEIQHEAIGRINEIFLYLLNNNNEYLGITDKNPDRGICAVWDPSCESSTDPLCKRRGRSEERHKIII